MPGSIWLAAVCDAGGQTQSTSALTSQDLAQGQAEARRGGAVSQCELLRQSLHVHLTEPTCLGGLHLLGPDFAVGFICLLHLSVFANGLQAEQQMY